jgi:hypothetical protein
MSVFPESFDPKYAAIVAALNVRFNHCAAIRPGEALTALPRVQAKDGETSARKMLRRGTYPFPTFFMGGLRCVLVADIARTLCNATGTRERPPPNPPTPETPARRRRGRPRKTAGVAGQEVGHV